MPSDEIRIYDHSNQLKKKLIELDRAPHLTLAEKQKIKSYGGFLHATNISQGRIAKNVHFILCLSRDFGMKLDRILRNNIQEVVGKVHQSRYSENSKHDIKAFIKKYIKYTLGKSYDPRDWEWIKMRVRKEKVKLPAEGDILSVEEIERMLALCRSVRDKAFLSCLYESACRPSEMLTLKMKDVKFDRYGCVLNLRQSKTMIRPVRLVNSAAYLNAWINIHPGRKNIESPLWVVGNSSGHVGLAGISKSMKLLAKKGGIKKRIYPYLLRHSRITHLLRNPKYPHSVIKRIVGWTDDSSQISTYLHMSNDTVDNIVLEANGIKGNVEREEVELNRPLLCPRCEMQNPYDAKVCQRCWFALDAAFQTEIDEAITEISSTLKDPETLKVLQMNVKELQHWRRQKMLEVL